MARPDREEPVVVARSAGFADDWVEDAKDLAIGFGERIGGMRCPLTVFAKPLTPDHVAVVRVKDDADGKYPTGLRFHFLVVEQSVYEDSIRDPFMLAERIEPAWQGEGTLPAVTIAADAFLPRTVAQVQAVLKRVKAAALREGEDPEAPDFVRTAENSESPALLGGAQILVDGGRLLFERPHGDLALVAGLWLLLPEMTRCRLWPTSFAFGDDLDFDVLVMPRLREDILERYTTEEQAEYYPAGQYEMALQVAAESGNQRDLDAVFLRRDSRQTIRLAVIVLAIVSALVVLSRWL